VQQWLLNEKYWQLPFLMNSLEIFILVYILLILVTAKFIVKYFKSFRKSLYWFLYPSILSIWSKKTWDKDFNNSFKMEIFSLVSFILFWVGIFIYQWLIP